MGSWLDPSSGMDDGGGYDLKELEQAREVNNEKSGDEKGFEEVELIFIEVSMGKPVRQEEFEARSVLIEYDEFDNVVSVELL